ncbi:TetR/AcrR family transcriptional regulator [Gulosibacter sp. 10]|uniref:TetR/AcrR family transcriptional regulator n=1 Tax=Gulosibacter sp. 10 TaxID=1255570 RepID=UPI00097ECED9|nr:TetR/AcrR family transcriptional regulator [Gulosibacter sp. 10]SJM65735.1 Transcriptional regulator, TetR family [Gulosibacter sp. 10]
MTSNETITKTPKRGRPGNDRRDVITAAVELFNQHGYEATTVGMIAERLGVSKSAIYHHVASKEDLLASALDRALSSLETVLAGQPAAEPITARLEFVLRGTVHALVRELESVTLLLRLRGNTELEREALARRRRFDRAVADLVRDADEAGELRAEIDPKTATRLVFGMVNSITEWYRPGGSLDADALGDLVVGLVFDGLRPR